MRPTARTFFLVDVADDVRFWRVYGSCGLRLIPRQDILVVNINDSTADRGGIETIRPNEVLHVLPQLEDIAVEIVLSFWFVVKKDRFPFPSSFFVQIAEKHGLAVR